MANKHPPSTNKKTLSQFLTSAQTLPARSSSSTQQAKRLLFSLDATASRQPTWDQACQLQGHMFEACQAQLGLEVQLCYYRGFNELHHSGWVKDAHALIPLMSLVTCLGGMTQINRILDHALAQTKGGLNTLVFIGDAVEEDVDLLCQQAGKLGMLGVPVLMFQEGIDPGVESAFRQIAKLSNGAYCQFDQRSRQTLADLLAAAATYASGGHQALAKLTNQSAQQLLAQLPSR